MLLRSPRSPRRGATLVETAIVYSVVLLLTIGMIVVGLGVFRYLQVAALAREATRWASVHGGQYAADFNSNVLTTQPDVYNQAILPHAAGLDTSKLTYTVTWADPGEMPTYTTGGNTITNIVTVTVNYTWIPEMYLGTMTLSSTAKTPVSY